MTSDNEFLVPPKTGNPTPTQPCFNTAAFAATLDQNACPASKGQCARYVRLALAAGGINTTGRPNAAGDYGPFLQSKGFMPVSVQGYKPQVGDIAMFGKTDVHPYGHVTGFDAVKWVSDFVQKHMNPYKAPATAGPLTVYRNLNPCGG
jgi:CHAP domain-containing protein